MNIYDKKVVKCAICKKAIGEINYDSKVILPRCGDCADPMPKIDDFVSKMNYDFPKDEQISTIPN